ncbi:MAG: 16S rRNA (cytosine(967)-C(5))-methyltransferase RsmB [Chitinophagales bacterium]
MTTDAGPVRRQAREVALQVLCAVEERGAYANLALSQGLERAGLSPSDRSFATELVYGTVRRRLTLDWVLEQFLTRPFDALAPWLQSLLRLSAYQLLYLEHVPPEAVCNEAVELAKRRGHRGIAGLVNAVLRSLLRGRSEITWPDPQTDPVEYLSVRESHPAWLVRRWLQRLGYAETAQLLAADNATPPLTLRANRCRMGRDELLARLAGRGLAAEPCRWAPEGVTLRSRTGSVERLPEITEGLAQVQDEASMLVARLAAPEPGHRVLDCASAPGGKATHLAELMGDSGHVCAFDVHPGKLRLVEENAARLGLRSVQTAVVDALAVGSLPEFAEAFDRCLLDAPCTGLGVLRRKADSRWRKAEGDIPALARQQGAMLASAARTVKRGGRLVYSTCSTEREEGEDVIERFLEGEGHAFRLLDAGEILTAQGIPARTEDSLTAGRYLRLWPQRHGTDGFFAAALVRL